MGQFTVNILAIFSKMFHIFSLGSNLWLSMLAKVLNEPVYLRHSAQFGNLLCSTDQVGMISFITTPTISLST